MKTLAIDIETSPNIAHVWSLWNQNVGLPQLIEPSRMICFAAQWIDQSHGVFHSEHHESRLYMINAAWCLLEDADAVITYNGDRFDLPHLRREFLEAGFPPPSPFKSIDLLKTAKRVFRFPSNKLAYITKALGFEGKLETGGHELWKACMAGEANAWAKMEAYNRRDTAELIPLYERLLPWIPGHPSHAAFAGDDRCPACGDKWLIRQGYAFLRAGKYQRYVCGACGKWSRSSKRSEGTSIVEVA